MPAMAKGKKKKKKNKEKKKKRELVERRLRFTLTRKASRPSYRVGIHKKP